MPEDEEAALAEANERYRDRWLNVFLASYATIGVVSGIAVSVALTIRTEDNELWVQVSSGLGVLVVILVLKLFLGIRRLYDTLAFGKDPQNEEEYRKYEKAGRDNAINGQRSRKRTENLVHIALVLQLLTAVVGWAMA